MPAGSGAGKRQWTNENASRSPLTEAVGVGSGKVNHVHGNSEHYKTINRNIGHN
jgi:hypothetical protein